MKKICLFFVLVFVVTGCNYRTTDFDSSFKAFEYSLYSPSQEVEYVLDAIFDAENARIKITTKQRQETTKHSVYYFSEEGIYFKPQENQDTNKVPFTSFCFFYNLNYDIRFESYVYIPYMIYSELYETSINNVSELFNTLFQDIIDLGPETTVNDTLYTTRKTISENDKAVTMPDNYILYDSFISNKELLTEKENKQKLIRVYLQNYPVLWGINDTIKKHNYMLYDLDIRDFGFLLKANRPSRTFSEIVDKIKEELVVTTSKERALKIQLFNSYTVHDFNWYEPYIRDDTLRIIEDVIGSKLVYDTSMDLYVSTDRLWVAEDTLVVSEIENLQEAVVSLLYTVTYQE